MEELKNIFHLAIPCANLDDAKNFYVDKIGCRLARIYDDRITLDFFGDQVVCHLCSEEDIDSEPKLYPRHFGMTFGEKEEYEKFLNRAKEKEVIFFREPFTRFAGKREEHSTFFLIDPSNNVLEFKYYSDPEMRY